jgi:uncharacterized membrane protein YphA (DoxX/SURF4 family)
MNDSMAQPQSRLARLDLPKWKWALNWTAAVLLAILFLSSGIWKITDVQGWAVRLTQAKVPESLSIAGTIAIGVSETLAGVLLMAPRLRRWGALLSGALLVLFVVYFGIHYQALRGMDCSCFPWLKRAVGPGFFIGDGAMLMLAVVAGVWARKSEGLRAAVLIFGAVAVFAMVSYGVEAAWRSSRTAPQTVSVDGQPLDISKGKVLVYFFNPACTHCTEVAKRMSQFDWNDTRVVAAPVELPQFAGQFLAETGLRGAITSDFEALKRPLGYHAYPYAAALVDGRMKTGISKMDGDEPAATLRKLGFVR